MAKRNLIVVDVETTGLHDSAIVVEVAAINADTGQELYFIPNVTQEKFGVKDLFALKLNGYVERELWNGQESPNTTLELYHQLGLMLEGNTFAGSNPAFDTRMLRRHVNTTWHHRLGDLATYAAKPMGRDITDLPGLSEVAEFFGVEIPGRHGALADARATAELFNTIRNWEA